MFATKKIHTLAFVSLLFISYVAAVWPRAVEKHDVFAVLTFNVASFTSWPMSTFNNAEPIINLCVFGNSVVQQSFENINNKVINDKKIRIINLLKLRNLTRCQILYLSELDRSRLAPLLVEMEGQSILTIGESMEFLQAGGMVGFEKINGKIQLTINLTMIKRCELSISSRLLKLAKIVDYPVSPD